MAARRVQDRKKAIALRAGGKSYAEIQHALGIRSKGTLSSWLKSAPLSHAAKKRLEHHTRTTRIRNFKKFNEARSARIEHENQVAYEEGADIIGNSLTLRELTLIGAALYWGEGTKSSRNKKELVSFANSDPRMISVFLKFVRAILKVPEHRIRAGMHIYTNTTESAARTYWATVTGLPRDRFYVVRQVSRASTGARPIRSLPHGTAVIRINDHSLFFRVTGMVQGLAKLSSVDV